MSPESLQSRKKALRRQIYSRLDSLNHDEIRAASGAICRTVLDLPEWTNAPVVLVFLSMDNEVDTSALVRSAFDAGKIVGAPRMHGKEILFHRIDSPEGPFETHSYGIREPGADLPVLCPPTSENEPERLGISTHSQVLVIAPGCAFDDEGRRLGHGMGYYDGFFRAMRRPRTGGKRKVEPGAVPYRAVAVCFDIQIVDEVPTGPNDVKVDTIVSESGIIYRS